MPNLRPPVTTTAQAVAYRERILAALPEGSTFEPLMTLYLTDNLPPDEIKRAKDAGIVAVKLYPAGATTNSDAGVTDLRKTYRTLEAMQREGLKLLVHGEVTDPDIDLFDREAVFIDARVRAAAARPARAEGRVRAHHDQGGGAVRAPRPTRSPPPRSPRTTCSTTATRSSWAACGRTTTACRCSSARCIAWRWSTAATSRQRQVLPRHRQRAARVGDEGGRRSAAPAASRRCRRSSCTPRPSTPPARSTSSKASRATTAPTSTACRATPAPSRCAARAGSCPRACPSATRTLKPLRGGETLAWKQA